MKSDLSLIDKPTAAKSIFRTKSICMEIITELKESCSDKILIFCLKLQTDERFESLFVTRLSTVKQPNNPGLEKFDAYINQIKMILDKLLEENWTVLGIVDLSKKSEVSIGDCS